MPVERQIVSISQLAELVGVDPARLIAVDINRPAKTATLILEPEHDAPAPRPER